MDSFIISKPPSSVDVGGGTPVQGVIHLTSKRADKRYNAHSFGGIGKRVHIQVPHEKNIEVLRDTIAIGIQAHDGFPDSVSS
ncbi:hypothetical protein L1887_11308 [Cichorium endivia]|nr:hypothetical protein L1887_11308 [Cichorium endivia]